jgi:hypothetical protein
VILQVFFCGGYLACGCTSPDRPPFFERGDLAASHPDDHAQSNGASGKTLCAAQRFSARAVCNAVRDHPCVSVAENADSVPGRCPAHPVG